MAWAKIAGRALPGQKIPGAVSYRLTNEDVLWAARMAVYETVGSDSDPRDKPQQALEVLWTMASIFAYRLKHVCKDRGCATQEPRWPTYTKLIQAYSQPINPIWRRTGSKCAGSSRAACSPGRLAARDRHATVSLAAMRAKYPNTIQVVEDWAKGKSSTVLPPEYIREKTGQRGVKFSLRNPIPGSVEFAAPGVSQHFVRKNPGSRVILKHGNWFISTPYSQRFPANWPRMSGSGVSAGPILLAATVVAGTIAGMFLLG